MRIEFDHALKVWWLFIDGMPICAITPEQLYRDYGITSHVRGSK